MNPLIVEREYNAPIAKVWSAITDHKEMKAWYFELDEFRAEPGFVFHFYGENEGRSFKHICTVLEADAPHKLSYSWAYEGYEGYSVVSFELTELPGNRTAVRLTHTGLESFPQDNADFARTNFEAGWNAIIGKSLPQYVENQ